MKKYRNYAMVLSVFGMALLLVGVTYSFFNFTRTGGVNNLGTGNISFNAEYGTAINITNLFPISSSDVNNANLTSTTIGITGSTTYSDGEEFLVSIVDVNNTVNGKKIPINYVATYEATTGNTIGTSTDNYFEATKNANIYKLNSTGSVVEDKQVLVGFIKTEIGGMLTIKPYIDADRIAITDTPEENSSWINGRTVFSTTEWNSLSSTPLSFKLRTESNEGIWVEEPDPDNVTPESCFDIRLDNIYTLNTNMTQTELDYCIDGVSEVYLYGNATAEDYCLGRAYSYDGTFQARLDSAQYNGYPENYDYFIEHNVISAKKGISVESYDISCGSDIVFPSKMNYTQLLFNYNMTSQEINSCVDYFTNNLGIRVNTDNGETMQAICSGTGTYWGISPQEMIDDIVNRLSSAEKDELKSRNIVQEGETKKYPVSVIGSNGNIIGNQNNGGITSITFNKNLIAIEEEAFENSLNEGLTDITLPANVRFIGLQAFSIYGEPLGNPTFTILGKPNINYYAIESPSFSTITYGGTCDELHKNSVSWGLYNKSYIIEGTSGEEHDVITTDTNYCKVYSGFTD